VHWYKRYNNGINLYTIIHTRYLHIVSQITYGCYWIQRELDAAPSPFWNPKLTAPDLAGSSPDPTALRRPLGGRGREDGEMEKERRGRKRRGGTDGGNRREGRKGMEGMKGIIPGRFRRSYIEEN